MPCITGKVQYILCRRYHNNHYERLEKYKSQEEERLDGVRKEEMMLISLVEQVFFVKTD